MYNGATITGNTANFAAVEVSNNASFTMHGGAITNNTNNGGSGGGVIVQNGTFNMFGGIISNNTAIIGGGVSINGVNTIFNMYGTATISGNTATSATLGGGGIDVAQGTFSISGGLITGTDATGTDSAANGAANGAALRVTGGTAQWGSGVSWTPFDPLVENNTIEVINGVLVRPITGLSLELDFCFICNPDFDPDVECECEPLEEDDDDLVRSDGDEEPDEEKPDDSGSGEGEPVDGEPGENEPDNDADTTDPPHADTNDNADSLSGESEASSNDNTLDSMTLVFAFMYNIKLSPGFRFTRRLKNGLPRRVAPRNDVDGYG